MERPNPGEYHPNYQKYFDLVPSGEYLELLRQNSTDTATFFESIPHDKHDYRYADGKWSVKELLMHLIDTERVFSYRALAAARGDNETPVYRMDEELYAGNVDVSRRDLASLLAEFKAVRAATSYLFENIGETQSTRLCNVVTHPMTARAIGYFIIGHVQHHVGVVKERYLTTDTSGTLAPAN
jgi:uncharacterized damage-inducible protein DinB